MNSSYCVNGVNGVCTADATCTIETSTYKCTRAVMSICFYCTIGTFDLVTSVCTEDFIPRWYVIRVILYRYINIYIWCGVLYESIRTKQMVFYLWFSSKVSMPYCSDLITHSSKTTNTLSACCGLSSSSIHLFNKEVSLN